MLDMKSYNILDLFWVLNMNVILGVEYEIDFLYWDLIHHFVCWSMKLSCTWESTVKKYEIELYLGKHSKNFCSGVYYM